MKHKGSSFEYEKERNEDLLRAYRHQIDICKTIVIRKIFAKVVAMPSKRFWVSEERASIVISQMYRGDNLKSMRPTTREMYNEIFKRVNDIRKHHPELPMSEVIFRVVRQPAPKFYLTPDSARVIVANIRRNLAK